MAMIKELALSSDKPSNLEEKWFHIWNLGIFAVSSLTLWLLKSEYPLARKKDLPYVHWWLGLFAAVVLYLLVRKNLKKTFRFISLTIYAQNRAIIFLMLLNIVYFPIELIIFTLMDNYQASGLGLSTLIMKIISYAYFYFLFVKLVYLSVFQKGDSVIKS